MIHKLPDLRGLSVVTERDTLLPTLTLPDLTNLIIKYDNESDWLQMFRRATFGKLEAVTFHWRSEQIGSFLKAFKRVALATSVQNTLSKFQLRTSCSWNPNYSSLLPFTQLTHLVVGFSCSIGCSSTVDDNVMTNLARTMPKLEILRLGDDPCSEILTGVTVKGLVVLAHHCPNLTALRIHFQVTSLSAPPAAGGVTSNAGSAALRRDCALRLLEVGGIPMAEEPVATVAVILAQIFPRIERVQYFDGNWEKVTDAIHLSRQIINYSSKERLSTPRSDLSNISLGAMLDDGSQSRNRPTGLPDFAPVRLCRLSSTKTVR